MCKVNSQCMDHCALMTIHYNWTAQLITTWQQAQTDSHKHSYVSACCAVYTRVMLRFGRQKIAEKIVMGIYHVLIQCTVNAYKLNSIPLNRP